MVLNRLSSLKIALKDVLSFVFSLIKYSVSRTKLSLLLFSTFFYTRFSIFSTIK